ncbi:hypothetical protein QMK19_38395 [Streptomyces sp. H10-C2]|uniref:Ku protein n=1 Tax=unclassified Streptomyces TaxID=2593676 RepID=UPI0024BAAF17|nr:MULTISPECIES: Ku protein [unclassified Streptomyces]MDJ0347048.1 hypothetical protein [Streptomyces sp. PH10-H1]MDJ0375316.1 hypothetical protein [Streptomyces sp. H10-C2]
MVAIPVRMGSIVSSHKIPFRQMHREDGGPVRYRKKCEIDDQVLDQSEIGRAYETPDGTLVEITDDELANMPLLTAKTIEVNGFLNADSGDSLQLDTPYVLAPGQGGEKPYVLMRRARQGSGKAAVGKVAMSGKEKLPRGQEDRIAQVQAQRMIREVGSQAADKGGWQAEGMDD